MSPGPGDPDPPDTPRGDVHHIGAAMKKLLRGLDTSAPEAGAIWTRWAAIVGDAVAAHARPVALRDGVLRLAVDQPAWATQLRLLHAEMLARLAQELGAGVVTALEVRVEERPRTR